MSFNNWEKVSKAQRDYPKPKFAAAVVDKALKKNPTNPFLLAWKNELGLKLGNMSLADIAKNLTTISSQSGTNDDRFLSYFYGICAQTCRKQQPRAIICSIGIEWLKPWQAAVKNSSSKDDRQDIWNALFLAALSEDIWEDVRFAVTNYAKEESLTKDIHYIRILTQLKAAQQKRKSLGQDDQMSMVSLTLTRRQMKQSFEANTADAVGIQDIRDLRFMADVYARQNSCNELWSLWENPPSHLVELMTKHKDDLTSLKTRLLRRQGDWLALEEHCYKLLDEALSKYESSPDSKILWELCSWNYYVWESLMEALTQTGAGDKKKQKLAGYVDRCFGSTPLTKSRPLRLTNLALRKYLGAPLLDLCKEYWEHHHMLPSCYSDLVNSIEALSTDDQKDLYDHVLDHVKTIRAESEGDFSKWQQAESNFLKIQYFLTISSVESPQRQAYEVLLKQSISPCIHGSEESDTGFIPIYTLLRLHHQESLQTMFNSKLLIQAAMLSRQLMTKDKKKENRTMALLTARLHLNLGLGKIAFSMYPHAKCKEMLLDTLAPYILSSICISHPFNVSGYRGFSAGEELKKVVSTIEGMQSRTDSFIFRELPNFLYDQAFEALEMKRKFKSSQTRQMCAIELSRIARLHGEPADDAPLLSNEDLSDNIDRSVFPSFEPTNARGPLPLVMPNDVPDYLSSRNAYPLQDIVCKILYKEGAVPLVEDIRNVVDASSIVSESTSTYNDLLLSLWRGLSIFAGAILYPENYKPTPPTLEGIVDIQEAMETLRKDAAISSTLEDAPSMFHENMLNTCYTALEVLRAITKFIALLREKVVGAKSLHPLKSKLPKGFADNLEKDTKACYESIRNAAQTYITLVKQKGVAAIKAQVRYGTTGEILKQILTDDDVEYYAKEYVDSAVEGWNGVLKVKL